MKASEIAGAAAALLDGDRQRTHGDKIENHKNIACLWDAYMHRRFGLPLGSVTAKDVALMMNQLKVARTMLGNHNPDDYVDGVGYVAIAGEIAAIQGGKA